MKSITLTNDQTVKLMEMCNNTFPEYKTIHIMSGSCDYCLEGTLKISKKAKPNHNDWTLIHWYEFTFTHLLTKLVQKLGYEDSTDYVCMDNGIPLNNEIIDFIYNYIYPITK